MTNNQTNLNDETNQLSDDELKAVAGGGERFPKIGEYVDVAKDFIGDVKEAGKDAISEIRDIRNP